MSKGWLNASHREKDEERSTPTRPFYTHTNPQPIKPGEIYEFDIEVLPVSYVFKKGHRIRLEIANGDSAATDSVFTHPYHPTLMGTDTFHHDGSACVVHHAAGDVRRSQHGHSGSRAKRGYPKSRATRDSSCLALDSGFARLARRRRA